MQSTHTSLTSNGRRQMATPIIHNSSQDTFQSERNRDRPTYRWMQQTHGDLSSGTQRNWRTMRRNLAIETGRHRLRKQNRKHYCRKEQQPPGNTS